MESPAQAMVSVKRHAQTQKFQEARNVCILSKLDIDAGTKMKKTPPVRSLSFTTSKPVEPAVVLRCASEPVFVREDRNGPWFAI